jgi:hypothetical protein
MELYTLDPLLRRERVIDRFESLIWTERFSTYGDFQLDIVSTIDNRNIFRIDTLLAMNESHRVMMVEYLSNEVNDNGEMILTVKGRSLEAILIDRAAKESLDDLTVSPKWVITDPPADVARKIFHDICVLGILNTGDIIPFVIEGTFMPASTIAEPIDPITVELEPTNVYDATVDICNVWNLGFRLLRNYDTSELYYDIYAGSNRTTSQTTLAPVVFAPELDNLTNTKELTSTDKAKNVAYVFSPAGFQMVYPIGVESTVEGFERRVLMVNASDITSENPDVPAALIQRGNEALAENRVYQGFDGEISQNSQYKYGRDYNLGDVIEVRNTDGVTNNMKVTEQIFVQDREGERAYPTLTLNTFINTGSWLSWNNNKTWSELTTEVWAELP